MYRKKRPRKGCGWNLLAGERGRCIHSPLRRLRILKNQWWVNNKERPVQPALTSAIPTAGQKSKSEGIVGHVPKDTQRVKRAEKVQ